LIDKNLIHKNEVFKILGRGEITSALEVHANKFSETAKAAIEKAGGSVHTIGR
jgi:large subunit ribosomal protein L15